MTDAPTLDPDRQTIESLIALARTISNGGPIDPNIVTAALVGTAQILEGLIHTAEHAFLVVNPACESPDCPLRSETTA